MSRLARAYVLCGLIFLALDAVWLTQTAEPLYRAHLGDLMAPQPRLGPAVAFYLIYLAGVTGFCIAPARRARDAFVRGAAFGFVAYATYDLTNQATLATWPVLVTALDLLWGAVATSISAGCAAALILRSAQPGRGRS